MAAFFLKEVRIKSTQGGVSQDQAVQADEESDGEPILGEQQIDAERGLILSSF